MVLKISHLSFKPLLILLPTISFKLKLSLKFLNMLLHLRCPYLNVLFFLAFTV